MGYTVLYVIAILSLGLFAKNNRTLNLILAITLYLLFAFERSDQDYLNYLQSYDLVGSGSISEMLRVEPSYFLFCTLGNKYGLTFDAARAIVCVFEVLAIFTTIRVFSTQIACILALFLIFPATADAELFRWLGAMSVVIYALPYLIRGESKRDFLMYSFLVVLATSLHTSCIFFLFYNIIYINDKKLILFIVIAFSTVLLVFSQTSILYKILSYLPIQESLNEKFQETGMSNIFGVIALAFREFFIFFIAYVTGRKYNTNTGSLSFVDGKFSLKRRKYSQQQMCLLLCDKLWNINIVSLSLIAVSLYTPQVQRLFHVLLFVNTIAAIYVSLKLHNKKVKLITIACVVITLILHISNGPNNIAIFMSHFNEGFLVNFIDVVFYNKPF